MKEIHAKYSTKLELYRFLAARNNVYLPHHKHVTIWFLKDVLSGKKMRKCSHDIISQLIFLADIDGNAVKTLNVPYYEYLTVARMWDLAAKHPNVLKYMPAEEDRDALPRAWIINIFYTVLGKTFSDWVDAQLERRNKERAKEQNTEAVLLDKFAASFKASTDVSGKYLVQLALIMFLTAIFPIDTAAKGIGADLLKANSNRRRSKQQIKADKAAQALKEKQQAQAQQLLAGLPGDPQQLAAKLEEAETTKAVLDRLVEQGVLVRGVGGVVLPARK